MSIAQKVANELKMRGIEITPPVRVEHGAKIGFNGKQNYQFGISSENEVKKLIDNLASKAIDNKLTFAELVIPTCAKTGPDMEDVLEKSKMLEQDGVLIRYMKMRRPKALDKDAPWDNERWDAFVTE